MKVCLLLMFTFNRGILLFFLSFMNFFLFIYVYYRFVVLVINCMELDVI